MPPATHATTVSAATTKYVEALVAKHRKLRNEPLHLAMQFADARHRGDVCLIEIIGGFGSGHINPDKRFLEVEMKPAGEAQLPNGASLRFIFTSPEELKVADEKRWPALVTLRKRLASATTKVHYVDDVGRRLKALLHDQ